MLGLVLLAGPRAEAADAAAELRPLHLEDVVRVRYHAGIETAFVPLYADRPQDRSGVEQLLAAYNQALGSLGDAPLRPGSEPSAAGRITLSLRDGRNVTILLWEEEVRIAAGGADRSLRVTDDRTAARLRDLARRLFRRARGVELSARRVRLGQSLTVTADDADEPEVHILLVPQYWPVRIPSAEPPFPVPEAILVATVRPDHGYFRHTFALSETLGRRQDGSPGRIGPGAWSVWVSGAGLPLTILPAEPGPPRAVAYVGGRVAVWTPREGLRWEGPVDPGDQPLFLSRRGEGSPYPTVTAGFLDRFLDVPVIEAAPDRLRVGDPTLNLELAAGEGFARVSSTMLALEGAVTREAGRWRLPWDALADFLDYRTRCLGPDTVVFLRSLERVPEPLAQALAPARRTAARVPVRVRVAGRALGPERAYLDAGSGRVWVALRPVVETLRGRVDLLYLPPASRSEPFWSATSLGEDVTALVDVAWGERRWRVYLAGARGGTTFVPLNALATALGLPWAWDPATRTAVLGPSGR